MNVSSSDTKIHVDKYIYNANHQSLNDMMQNQSWSSIHHGLSPTLLGSRDSVVFTQQQDLQRSSTSSYQTEVGSLQDQKIVSCYVCAYSNLFNQYQLKIPLQELYIQGYIRFREYIYGLEWLSHSIIRRLIFFTYYPFNTIWTPIVSQPKSSPTRMLCQFYIPLLQQYRKHPLGSYNQSMAIYAGLLEYQYFQDGDFLSCIPLFSASSQWQAYIKL